MDPQGWELEPRAPWGAGPERDWYFPSQTRYGQRREEGDRGKARTMDKKEFAAWGKYKNGMGPSGDRCRVDDAQAFQG